MKRGLALVILLMIAIPSAGAFQRIELNEDVSLIISDLREDYYILGFVNKKDHNITGVDSIEISFEKPIDPLKLKAVDNHNQTVLPDKIEGNLLVISYKGVLPALGYGKIFLDLNATTTSTTTTTNPTTTTTSTTTTTTTRPKPPPSRVELPPETSSPPILETANPTQTPEPLSTPKPRDTKGTPNTTRIEGGDAFSNLIPYLALIFLFLLLVLAWVLFRGAS